MNLIAAEADHRDTGRTIARIDPEEMGHQNVLPGEIIGITGTKTTYVRVLPSHPHLRGRGLIYLDGIDRTNAGVSLGDNITIYKASLPYLQSAVLRPLDAYTGEVSGTLLEDRPVVSGGMIRIMTLTRDHHFLIESANPAEGIFSRETIVTMKKPASASPGMPFLRYEDIGGLGSQVEKIREMIELPLRYPELFERIGIDPPKGVLLHGPPGCGKTLIARVAAHETDAHLIFLSGPEIVSKYYGESESKLREIFDEAGKKAPSIICIDEIDAIAPKREDVGGEKQVERRIVGQLLSLMDGLKGRGRVLVIATTNVPNLLDPALRRPGRFDREIIIPVPDQHGREEILTIHTRGMPLAEDVILSDLAAKTHGYVGADLAALCREAAMHAVRRLYPITEWGRRPLTPAEMATLNVQQDDFTTALRGIEPSALREFFVEIPTLRWDEIGGADDTIARLRESVELPIRRSLLFKHAGITPPRGILLHGPPGCGKTMIARAAASETGVNFISVKGPELISRYVGDSERAIREVFSRARAAAPCIIFFDEIDAIAPTRGSHTDAGVSERVIAQLLTEMDGLELLEGVFVLAATNRLDRVDGALLRPGRFEHLLKLDLPNQKARAAIFRIHTNQMPCGADVNLDLYASITEGMSGAVIAGICRRAGMLAILDFPEDTSDLIGFSISDRHFRSAIEEFVLFLFLKQKEKTVTT